MTNLGPSGGAMAPPGPLLGCAYALGSHQINVRLVEMSNNLKSEKGPLPKTNKN